MIGPDKELKILKQSNLMQVIEYQKMVSSLQRFKDDLAVRALTGKKNIRNQQTQDRIFYSVLEKMLLEVVAANQGPGNQFHLAEQQLLALRKVHQWFDCNKQVLCKTDGYFPSARKITEDIYSKKNKPNWRRKAQSKSKRNSPGSIPFLKSLETHLMKVRELERMERGRMYQQSGTTNSMFAPSPTQDLTSVDTMTLRDQTNYQEDLEFARESYDREYGGGNKIEHLNRPMTAPSKLKLHKPIVEHRLSHRDTFDDMATRTQNRPQSAIAEVKHDLSWAKYSPIPLSKLIQREKRSSDAGSKQKIRVVLPTEEEETVAPKTPEQVTDPNRIANLVLFKEFCLQHAAQQESYLRQYINHKHETRQHYLEFPENKTENVVRDTANYLKEKTDEFGNSVNDQNAMVAYKDMSLEEFLNHEQEKVSEEEKLSERSSSAPARLTLPLGNTAGKLLGRRKTQTPLHESIVQPRKSNVTMSAVFELAGGTGEQMNSANQQALSAPKHGWRYPMVPVNQNENEVLKKEASGVLLAMQDGSHVQHKVMIPLSGSKKDATTSVNDSSKEALEKISPRSDTSNSKQQRPKSFNSINNESESLSRCSTRPQSSPRYFNGVSAVYRQYKVNIDGELSNNTDSRQASRSLNKTPTRPKTAASWCSNPANSEVSRSAGAASHHSIGMLKHRSVAQSMRVRSVAKFVKNNSREIHSGRSSASSYVAQLRAKKRTGAISSFSRPIAKKRDPVPPDAPPPPQLSFVNIVAPMHVPGDLSGTTYAAPGGVYCGTTAAVAIATEYTAGHYDEDMLSDDHLSYEDFHSVMKETEKSDDEKSEVQQDNWLSHWLSGGPLDGVDNGATNYADIVSRAAIHDSSGERSYSDEGVSSTGAPGLGMGSPKEELTITPRSDPLLTNRTQESNPSQTFDDKREVSDKTDEENEDQNISSDAGSPRSSFLSLGSSESDKNLSDQSEDAVVVVDDEKTKHVEFVESFVDQSLEDEHLENKSTANNNQPDQDVVENVEEHSVSVDEPIQHVDKSLNVEKSVTELNTTLADDLKFSKQVVEGSCKESVNVGEVKVDKDGSKHLTDPGNDDPGRDDKVDDVGKEDLEKIQVEEEESDSTVEDSDSGGNYDDVGSDDAGSQCSGDLDQSQEQLQNEVMKPSDGNVDLNDEESLEIHREAMGLGSSPEETDKMGTVADSGDSIVVSSQNLTVQVETDGDLKEITGKETFEDDSLGSEGKEEDSEDALTEISESDADSEVVESPHGSEEMREYFVNQECSIKVVITSPEKVERMLNIKKEKEAKRKEKLLKKANVDLSQSVKKTGKILKNVNIGKEDELSEKAVILEMVENMIDSAVLNAGRDNELENGIPGSIEANIEVKNASNSNMITLEDMSAVTSMSRPTSGRPIPSESNIRDPFVEFVASTRQKQIDRNTDVQTIFRGSVNSDAYKKFDPEERKMQEDQREAAVKMQRAFRKHLSRTRAARKFTGINTESLEWARAYKAKLKERSENRQRRMRESRSSGRNNHRREMQRIKRIGPHTNVYEIYHPGPSLPSPALVQDAALEIQRYVRGWLVRKSLNLLKDKLKNNDWELVSAVQEYRETLQRTQLRHGKLKPSLALKYEEFDAFLDQKKKFEMMFRKREFWHEVEESDLPLFFEDCDLYPSVEEIEEAKEIVQKSGTRSGKKKKHSKTGLHLNEVLEIAFHLFVPLGAHLE
ncbi:uncharacterized protein LOC113474865 [Ciona intestinalis]